MSADFPTNRKLIRDFSEGYLDTPEDDGLPLGATPDAKNGHLARIQPYSRVRRSSLEKRPGMPIVVSRAIAPGKKIDGLFEFRRTGLPRKLLAVTNGRLAFYDDVNELVSASVPIWTPGRLATMVVHRDIAFITDGTAQRGYDGVNDVFEPGQVKPTSVTDMVAVAPVGAGVSGTFEAQYCWYDPALDHESSMSETTGETVLVNQARQHAIPGGAPAARYTRWRAYVRRVDTNETKFTRVATVPIVTATFEEELRDVVRVDAAAPAGANDPPPVAWLQLIEHQGSFIGIFPNSSDFGVSRYNQPQSWHPSDVFSAGKGDGEPLTGGRKFGEHVVLMKSHASWRLYGDKAPFVVKQLHPFYGGVGPLSGGQVDGNLYDWDRERGPYVTDGQNTWRSLADGRIRKLIDTANKNALGDIRFIHAEGMGMVGWAFARGGVIRKRTIVWYSYLLDAWLPPWTGLEYAAFAQYTDSTGVTGFFVGDEWGRVFRMFRGNRDGPTNGTVSAIVDSATVDSVTVNLASWFNDWDGSAGFPVAVRSATTGQWQWRRVAQNTASTLELDVVNDLPFNPVPVAGDTVILGGIEWYHRTGWFDEDLPEMQKTFRWLYLQGRATSGDHELEIRARFDEDESLQTDLEIEATLLQGAGSGIWGVSLWNVGIWGSLRRGTLKKRLDRTAFRMQLSIENFYPDQPFTITALGYGADVNKVKVPSA